ncbi:hypothetical protein ABIA45_007287 [Bradyrhizobium sp. USDA 336]
MRKAKRVSEFMDRDRANAKFSFVLATFAPMIETEIESHA